MIERAAFKRSLMRDRRASKVARRFYAAVKKSLFNAEKFVRLYAEFFIKH